jgi:hypothetical protein
MMNVGKRVAAVIYMGYVQGPEKVNYICMKTMHAGTMDRGFTVYRMNLHHREVRFNFYGLLSHVKTTVTTKHEQGM